MALLIAAVGGGGKTTALGLLARQAGDRSVLLTTTTHIYPFRESRVCLAAPTVQELSDALDRPGIVCAGEPAEEGKLGRLAPAALEAALDRADLVLYEADGSRRLPLKLHRPDEPVILPGTHRCLVVAGLSAVGRPVGEVVHRFDLEPTWREEPERVVGPVEVVRCVLETVAASGLSKGRIKVFLNQVDALADPAAAEDIKNALQSAGLDCRAGNLMESPCDLLEWVLS